MRAWPGDISLQYAATDEFFSQEETKRENQTLSSTGSHDQANCYISSTDSTL